jgi:hypothetical protein
LIEIVKEILAFLKKLFFEKGLRETLAWLIQGSPLILRLAVLFFLLLSVILSFVVVTDISETNSIMIRALSSPIESAPRPSSAIEALLLASVLPQRASVPADPQKAQENMPTNSPEFSAELEVVKALLAKPRSALRIKEEKKTEESMEKQPVKGKKQKTPAENTNSLYVVNADDKPLDLSDTILSDRNDGFLFVPGAILPALEKYDPNTFFSSGYNEGLAQDISASQQVASLICETLRANFDGRDKSHSVLVPGTAPDQIMPKYVQAYLVFRSGVARLCENDAGKTREEQLKYYAKKFTPRTLLQTRFYFDATVHNEHLYSTSPYVDLGGNGVVETFCNYIPVGKKKQEGVSGQRTDAILCFDYPLAIDLRKEIRSEIARFGGTATDFVCNYQTNCLRDTTQPPVLLTSTVKFMSLFYPPKELTVLEDGEIRDKFAYAHDHATEATFFGDITILERDPESGVIKFTVPRGNNKILAIKFDVAGYQNLRTVWLSLTVACIAITAILALLILADYGLKLREQERAFNVVDSVMSDVPSPYARLDEDGIFLKVNDAFAQLVGYTSSAEATPELKQYTYEDFLVGNANKEVFHQIKKERREAKGYRSYSVELWTGRRPGIGPKKWVKVHGGDVPTPTTARNKPGQSFGILIPMDGPPSPVAVIVPKTPTTISEGQDRTGTG